MQPFRKSSARPLLSQIREKSTEPNKPAASNRTRSRRASRTHQRSQADPATLERCPLRPNYQNRTIQKSQLAEPTKPNKSGNPATSKQPTDRGRMAKLTNRSKCLKSARESWPRQLSRKSRPNLKRQANRQRDASRPSRANRALRSSRPRQPVQRNQSAWPQLERTRQFSRIRHVGEFSRSRPNRANLPPLPNRPSPPNPEHRTLQNNQPRRLTHQACQVDPAGEINLINGIREIDPRDHRIDQPLPTCAM